MATNRNKNFKYPQPPEGFGAAASKKDDPPKPPSRGGAAAAKRKPVEVKTLRSSVRPNR